MIGHELHGKDEADQSSSEDEEDESDLTDILHLNDERIYEDGYEGEVMAVKRGAYGQRLSKAPKTATEAEKKWSLQEHDDVMADILRKDKPTGTPKNSTKKKKGVNKKKSVVNGGEMMEGK